MVQMYKIRRQVGGVKVSVLCVSSNITFGVVRMGHMNVLVSPLNFRVSKEIQEVEVHELYFSNSCA